MSASTKRRKRKLRQIWRNRRWWSQANWRSIHRRARVVESQDEQWVVVLTFARTGSTLLMGLLNTLPGYCIRGENDGAVMGLQTWNEAMTARSKDHKRTWSEPTHPYWGIDEYPQGLALAQMRTLMLSTWIRPGTGATHVGYKELRWPPGGLSQHIAFLRKLMPGVKIILNHRNIDDVAHSGWYTGTDEERAWIARRSQEILDVAEADESVYLLEYEKLTQGVSEFMALAQWLGSEADPKAVAKALGTEHSVHNTRSRQPSS